MYDEALADGGPAPRACSSRTAASGAPVAPSRASAPTVESMPGAGGSNSIDASAP